MADNTIPITEWDMDNSPMASGISYGPEGSIEDYWTKMSANYAEAENGSLDDKLEKEFADDIFDVFRKSEDGEEDEEDDQLEGSGEQEVPGDEDIGHTLLSFAQGMMHDDEDDDDDDYDDDEDDDDDSGIDMEEAGQHQQQGQQRHDDDDDDDEEEEEGQGPSARGGMHLGDMHPNHTPLQGSSSSSFSGPHSQQQQHHHHSSSSSQHQQAPPRLSPAEMKKLASAYAIEQSEGEGDEEGGGGGGGAAGFLLDSDDEDDEDDDEDDKDGHNIPPRARKSNDNNNNNNNNYNKNNNKKKNFDKQSAAQRQQPQRQNSEKTQQQQKRVQQPPAKQQQKQLRASHPFLRQEGGGAAGKNSQNKKKNKKDIEKKHKMLLLAIVQKKQQEEDELLQAVHRAEAKRKRFKEALLEKAIRSKQSKAEEEEKEQIKQLENEIRAAENETKTLAPPRPRRTKPPAAVIRQTQQQLEEQQEADEAALQQEEDEARAKMETAVRARKRFVKNQKAILAALQAKKEEKAQRQEELEQEEQRLRELKRKRNEKFLRQREQKKSEQQEQEEGESAVAEGRVGVGSALSAVRATRSQEGHNSNHPSAAKSRPPAPTTRSVSATNAPSTPEEQEGEGEGGGQRRGKGRAPRRRLKKVQEASLREQQHQQQAEREKEASTEVEDAAARERRREEGKQRQEKVSQQLAMLAEQRRDAEQLARRKEERAKVRAELLRQRVQLEYSERKLMAIEDKFVNGDLKMRKPKIGAVPVQEEKKPKKKITTEMAVAMVDRMQVKKLHARQQAEGVVPGSGGGEGSSSMADVASQLLPPARDFLDWKKKHGVPVSGDSVPPGVFCMTGWYPCVKEALLERGWVFNHDPTSPHFDLKWTLKSSDISKGSLQPWQLHNHFLKNVALTTKIGLMKSLQQLNWIADITPEDIFPRGYDLSSPLEIQEYIDDFRHDHVVNVLKRLYLRVTGLETPDLGADSDSDSGSGEEDILSSASKTKTSSSAAVPPPPPPIVPNLDDVMVNKAVLHACLSVLTRYLAPHFAENGVDQEITVKSQKITAVEWELVQHYDMHAPGALPEGAGDEPVDDFLREKEREAALSAAQALPSLEKKKALADISHRARKEQYHREKERERASQALCVLVPLGEEGLLRLHTLLSQCKLVMGKQYGLNGDASGAKNMWIVKPAAKSRGRGIMAFNDLRKLLAYVELGKTGKAILTSSQWIVQKYMENPLIIANRKFDFRQWVLVVSWNPLTIYFYDEFYCRFSSEDYDTSDEAMSNTFVHLVNNSIGKDNENFHKPIRADNGEDISEFMWSDESFSSYTKFMTKSDATIKAIKTRMQDIAMWSLMCGSDAIEHRKNSWELYGFDYMMDDQWTPWLIEINSSPACDYSTRVTERYIKKALVDLLKVTLDVREWDRLPKGSGRPEKPDTGGWQCIYTGPTMDTNSFGTDMCVQGEAMKVPRKRQQQPQQRVQQVVLPLQQQQGGEREGEGERTDSALARRTPPSRSAPKAQMVLGTASPPLLQGQGTGQQHQQPQSEIAQSPIESAGSSSATKRTSSPLPPSSSSCASSLPPSIATLVQQNVTTEGFKAQASPIAFDDSDDDLSVERRAGEQEQEQDSRSSSDALDKLDNAQLTAHVRALVAVPVSVQKFDMSPGVLSAGASASARVSNEPAVVVPVSKPPRQVLKKGGGTGGGGSGGAARKTALGLGGAGATGGVSTAGGAGLQLSVQGAATGAAIPIKTYDPFA